MPDSEATAGPAEGDNKLPDLHPELAGRIKLLRRDMGNLLFHFTRGTDEMITIDHGHGMTSTRPGTAGAILDLILRDRVLKGTSGYIKSGENCVCFTEAPLHEFSTLFKLNELAASADERPRYEPYGVAVNKDWLFEHGGRPVIYDHPSAFEVLPPSMRHRFVPYDPEAGVDFTWEREWRVQTDGLELVPWKMLVVVPSAEEAAEIVYGHTEWEEDSEHVIGGPVPTWLAVSLDIFGLD